MNIVHSHGAYYTTKPLNHTYGKNMAYPSVPIWALRARDRCACSAIIPIIHNIYSALESRARPRDLYPYMSSDHTKACSKADSLR